MIRVAIVCAALAFSSALRAEDVTLTKDMLVATGTGAFETRDLELPNLSDKPYLRADRTDPGARILQRMVMTGRTNGHAGVVYDNRDRGHSTFEAEAYPGLARLRYGPDLKGSDFGLAGRIRLPAVVLGNSSTALTRGANARSLIRLAMTSNAYPRLIFDQYANNHLYLYPEHRDHDETDLYPANWPYTVTSQGSSGSDQPFLHAFSMSLAAISKDTMAHLSDHGLVVPTLQMLLRRNLLGVDREEAYYSGIAHPTVFRSRRLRTERMIGHAAALTPERVAPLVRIRVEEENFLAAAGLAGRSELLFDTPSAIARIWRGFEAKKTATLSAMDTTDPLGREIKFRWVLLRGDPDKVQIAVSDDTGRAEVSVQWHDSYALKRPQAGVKTSRIDIGVFADIGGEPSAPAMFSVSFPTHQARQYTTTREGNLQLEYIDYDAVSRQASFDPLLHWTAPWRDVVVRNDQGALVAWERNGTQVPAKNGEQQYVVDGAGGSLPTLRMIEN